MRTPIYLLAFLLCSCSAEKKLARLIARHPELVKTDTVVVRDTIIVPGDTLVKWRVWEVTNYDTVTIENERQVVKWKRIATGSPCDTAMIRFELLAATKPDTVFHEVKIPCDTIQPIKEVPVIPWYLWGILILLLVALVAALFKRQ